MVEKYFPKVRFTQRIDLKLFNRLGEGVQAMGLSKRKISNTRPPAPSTGSDYVLLHPAVADPDHVAYALLEQLLRQRHVRDFRHSG